MLGRVYTPYFNDIQTILAAYIQVYDGFSYQTESLTALKRNRLLESPYSCTSWSNDLPDNVPSFFCLSWRETIWSEALKPKFPLSRTQCPPAEGEERQRFKARSRQCILNDQVRRRTDKCHHTAHTAGKSQRHQ